MPEAEPVRPKSAAAPDFPDTLVEAVIAAARLSIDDFQPVLEALPAPIYLTDADGWVTYFNRACIDFAGRTPVPGQDRWCVTWRLHTEGGEFLPHEDCPMAVAVRERREVRGLIAAAERPDGTKVMFAPYPTPIFGEDGELVGAVNVLIDITDQRQANALRAQALRCRRLAQSLTDAQTVRTLNLMAREYDEKAQALNGSSRST
ncbi:MAG: PAS domain-containing protein [Allosphingosinicella sp.]